MEKTINELAMEMMVYFHNHKEDFKICFDLFSDNEFENFLVAKQEYHNMNERELCRFFGSMNKEKINLILNGVDDDTKDKFDPSRSYFYVDKMGMLHSTDKKEYNSYEDKINLMTMKQFINRPFVAKVLRNNINLSDETVQLFVDIYSRKIKIKY